MATAEHDRRINTKIAAIPDRRRLRDIESWLKAHFPTMYPVKVRVEHMAVNPRGEDDIGECYLSGRQLTIRVEKDLGRRFKVEVLLHEYAHAVVWPTPYAESHPKAKVFHADHGDAFWLAFGVIYRAFYDAPGWKTSSGFK